MALPTTAAELVALAQRAARDLFAYPLRQSIGNHVGLDKRGIVFRNVVPTIYDLLHTTLTAENTASPEALQRALLASAVRVRDIGAENRLRAQLGGRFCAELAGFSVYHDDGNAATVALLDALLSREHV